MYILSRTSRTAEAPKSSLPLMPRVTELEWQRKQCPAAFFEGPRPNISVERGPGKLFLLSRHDINTVLPQDLETSPEFVDSATPKALS